MINRLWLTFTISMLFTIAYCGQVRAQQAQGATGEQLAEPQVNTESKPQPPDQPNMEPAPQPQSQPSTPTASQPPLLPSTQKQPCVPQCRAGYVCRQGECVSRCNPPCESYETCTEDGACVSKQPASQQFGYKTEDAKPGRQHTGFFIRLTTGLGWSNAEAPYKIENSGFSGFGAFDIGGAVSENLIIHARIAGLGNVVDKEVTIDLEEDMQIETTARSISYGLLGGGLTYYFMPANIYMTFIVGLAGADFSVDERSRDLTDDEEEALEEDLERAEAGVGFNFDFGKEWWVGSEWGLGVAGRFSYASVSPNDSAESDDWLSCIGLGLLFTATYN